MADIIDLSLINDAKQHFRKLLDTRGVSYFLKKDGHRLFQIEQSKVDLIIRTAARSRATMRRPPRSAIDHCRREIRRELIRRVVEVMLQTGL